MVSVLSTKPKLFHDGGRPLSYRNQSIDLIYVNDIWQWQLEIKCNLFLNPDDTKEFLHA